MPFRMRWHIHGIAVSRDNDDPQSIADAIENEADTRLAEIATAAGPGEWPLNQRLYTNVMVVKFVEHDQLISWIAYMHKTVNYLEPIRDAYLRPENRLPDGRLHPRVHALLLREVQAMLSWIDETFSTRGLTLSTNDRTRRLRRSFVWGNLKFGDGNYFIRLETQWERERRHDRAEQQRERRTARKERDRLARRLAEREGL